MTTDNRTNEPSHNRITIQDFRDGEVSVIREDRVRAIACTLDELKRAVATYEARGALEDAGRPAGTFTEAQVEAAAKALYCMVRGVEIQDFEWPKWVDADNYRAEARAALVAAQGAAPQAGPDPYRVVRVLHEHQRDTSVVSRVKCVCGVTCEDRASHRLHQAELIAHLEAVPVLPSSGVDEDTLAEVIARSRGFGNGWEQIPPLTREAYREVARDVVQWLKGQGR